jgi:hypothetical protein
MTHNTPKISGSHKTVLIHETLQATIVMMVVCLATLLAVIKPAVVSSDLLSFVYGGALSYAGGRAAAARQALLRRGDRDSGSVDDASG